MELGQKLVFLDIDGVLNSQRFYENNVESIKKETDWPRCDIDQRACIRLQDIIKRTGAKVVISSTWRLNYYDFLVRFLSEYGIDVIGKTGRGCRDCVRGNEIYRWIKDNEEICGDYWKYKKYVILDDDSDMLYWQKDNFVHVNSQIGLSLSDVEIAVSMLNQSVDAAEVRE